ncbi:hypothetical protein QQS21_011615, partial [Conoideocrella luteorostrata]
MRLSVALLRDPEAERRARERAEAPTVKTEERHKREEAAKEKSKTNASSSSSPFHTISNVSPKGILRRLSSVSDPVSP